VPVFNAWLAAVRQLAEAEKGSLRLVDAFADNVTEEGILLDGKLLVEG
jgi:hypothetical protein